MASSLQAIAASYAPKQIKNVAQICVERFEDEGIENVVPVVVTITNSQIILGGGQAGCIFDYAGNQSISLTFGYPYANTAQKDVGLWTTRKRDFLAKEGQVVSFEVCEAEQDHNDPQWAVNGWHNMWLLRLAGDSSAPRCATEESQNG